MSQIKLKQINSTGASNGANLVYNGTTIVFASPSSNLAGQYESVTVDAFGKVTAGSALTLTGDVSGTSHNGTVSLTLPNVNSNTTTIGSASTVPVITANSKGLVTSITSATITPYAIGAIPSTSLGAASGVATLDVTGKLTAGQIPSSLATQSWVTSQNYLTSNQTITVSGDVTGSGTTALALNLINTGTAGTYTKITTDAQGRVTSGTTLSATDIPVLDASKITTGVFNSALIPAQTFTSLTGKPTTLSGYGITDAQSLNSNLTSLSSLSTGGIVTLTSTGNVTSRVITGTTGQITVLNGDGVTGNPTIALTATTVTPGTYNNVTVDSYGRATAGSNVSYLTNNQTITVTGDVTGSGATSLALTLASVGTAVSNSFVKITTDAKGRVTSTSSVASTDINTALGYTPVDNSIVGKPSGLATLDSSGTVPLSQLPTSITTGLEYKGVWDASTSWSLGAASSANKGNLYKISVTGTNSPTGSSVTQWNAGDFVLSDGTNWDKIDGLASEVISVNGRTGAVTLTSSDVTTALTYTPYNSTNPSGFISGITATGDVTGTSSTSSVALTLAASGVTAGTYGSASSIPSITVDAKGRVTAVTTNTINTTTTLTGDVTGSGSGTIATTLANTGTAGTYTKVTTDAQGRVTSGTSLSSSDIPSNLVVSGTGALTVPVGTTAQEPSSPTQGMIRMNSTTGNYEVYNGTTWTSLWASPAGAKGNAAFTQLSDTPSSYSGQANSLVVVNSSASGLAFIQSPLTLYTIQITVTGSNGSGYNGYWTPVTSNTTSWQINLQSSSVITSGSAISTSGYYASGSSNQFAIIGSSYIGFNTGLTTNPKFVFAYGQQASSSALFKSYLVGSSTGSSGPYYTTNNAGWVLINFSNSTGLGGVNTTGGTAYLNFYF